MSNKKTICLVIDHPGRDLKGVTLLAAKLTVLGYRTIICPLNISIHEIWKFTPDLVHLGYLRTNNQYFVDNLHRANILYTVLDTEGGVLEDFSVLCKAFPIRSFPKENLSLFFSWGESLEQYIVEHGYLKQSQIVTTGQPRIDFYHKKFHAGLELESIKKFGKFFLFNSIFSFSNPRFSSVESELTNAVRMYQVDYIKAKEQQKLEAEAQAKFIDLVKKTAKKYPEHHIIYRPHPFEGEDIYLKEFKHFNNITVTNFGQVDSWIYHSEAVVQLKCSTAFEATMLKKPVLLPIWIADLKGDSRINDISHIINSEELLFEMLDKIVSHNYITPDHILAKQEKILYDIYFKFDGMAHQRVAHLIDKLIKHKNSTVDEVLCKKLKSKFSINPQEPKKNIILKRIIRNLGIEFIGIKLNIFENLAVYRWSKSAKAFTMTDVSSILSLLKKTHPDFENLSTITPKSSLSKSTYSIEIIKSS